MDVPERGSPLTITTNGSAFGSIPIVFYPILSEGILEMRPVMIAIQMTSMIEF
jgi:hypothetical protein